MKIMKPALAIATLSVAVSAYATRAAQQTNPHHSMNHSSSQQYSTKQSISRSQSHGDLSNQADRDMENQSQEERAYRTEQEVQARGDYGVEGLSSTENAHRYTTQQEIAHGGEYGPGADRSVAAVEPAYRTQQDIGNGVRYEAFNDNSNMASDSSENEDSFATTQQEVVNPSETYSEESDDVATATTPSRSIASEKSETSTTTTGAATGAAATGAAATTTHAHKSAKAEKADKKTMKDESKKEETKNMKADNSGQNKEDHTTAAAKNADDQSNKTGDVEMTRKIRAELMNKENLSTYAKNVKIIVSGKEVVLRGPVRSEDEKAEIAKVASSIASNYQIKNELEIAKK